MPSMGLDPATNSRRKFTEHMQEEPIPANATPALRKIWEDTSKLMEKLAYHEAMQPNIDRMFNEPARRRSKVYFM